MKQSICTLIFLALLSGCAKITEENVPCTGPKPPAPIVGNTVVPLGYDTYVTPQNVPSGATLVWTGPNNLTANGSQLELNFEQTTNYGTYTVTAYLNGCASATTSFQVSATLSIPCNITDYTLLSYSNGTSENFSNDPQFYPSGYGGYNVTEYNNTADDGTPISVYIVNASYPSTGVAYSLDSTGYFTSGACYVQIGSYPAVYKSISGTVYSTTNGSYNDCLIFCNAKFKSSVGTYITITGSVEYFN